MTPVNFLRNLLVLLCLAAGNAPILGEDLTPQVLALFEQKCQECHHPDTNDDYPYLHEAVSIAE